MTTSGREGDDGEEPHDADCQDARLHSTTHGESLCRARQKVVPGGISTVRGTWARACGASLEGKIGDGFPPRRRTRDRF